MAKKPIKEKTLTISEKRVIIAKDALAQLKLGAYKPLSDNGYTPDLDNIDFESIAESCTLLTGKKAKDVELKSYLDKIVNKKKPCTVCAKGSLFISSVRKFNNFSLQDASDANNEISHQADTVTQKLFGKANADLIEKYFEGWTRNWHNNLTQEESDRIESWKIKYPEDDQRLEAILKNIIKNNGTFKPKQI